MKKSMLAVTVALLLLGHDMAGDKPMEIQSASAFAQDKDAKIIVHEDVVYGKAQGRACWRTLPTPMPRVLFPSSSVATCP